jgi:bifunctional NMN adenylyltransferase/nudix hydrolase
MLYEFDYLIFICRAAPFHNGHLHIIEKAAERAKNVLVLLGSSNLSRSPRNPFTFDERCRMIRVATDHDEQVIIKPLRDFTYNDNAWIANTQAIVKDIGASNRIGLIGFDKDKTSSYLKVFQSNWKLALIGSQYGTINATDIRHDFLRRTPRIPQKHICHPAVAQFMEEFTLSDQFKWLVAEREFYIDYKRSWGVTPFPVQINCVDAVVIQSGHVLLVERGKRPGKGLLALPGGHVESDESFRNAVIRELREETHISDGKGEIPPAMLSSFIVDNKTRLFDDPHRSERGRVVTLAHLFQLPNRPSLFHVRGDDDAAHAKWYKIGEINPIDLFEDHAAIIEEMTGTQLSTI